MYNHIFYSAHNGSKPSNGTDWAAFLLSAFLPLGRIVRLRLGLSSHVVGIFEHFGQAQYPQKSRKSSDEMFSKDLHFITRTHGS